VNHGYDGLVKFELLTAVNIKITVFWDLMLSKTVDTYEYFGETCCSIFRVQEVLS
jgi:hypothetical protein